ncbi:MAG: hypothetical protein AABY64_07990 [Bdellovibrionota bacterium]
MTRKLFFFWICSLFLISSYSWAQNDLLENAPEALNDAGPPPTKIQGSSKSALAPKKSEGNVLDFEGEVIEGERRRPDLFLQMSIDNVKFDSLIYQRDDFNDYLDIDRKSRTRYLKLK